jgi:hypothetical protein
MSVIPKKSYNLLFRSSNGIGTNNYSKTYYFDSSLLDEDTSYKVSFSFMSEGNNENPIGLAFVNLDLGQSCTYDLAANSNNQLSKIIGFITPQPVNGNIGSYTITGTTITTNILTLNTTVGLVAGLSQVQITGTGFGGLTAGIYTVATKPSATTITLANTPTLTTATGNMNLALTNVNFMGANTNTNQPIFLDRRPFSNVYKVDILDEYGYAWLDANLTDISNYTMILNFQPV